MIIQTTALNKHPIRDFGEFLLLYFKSNLSVGITHNLMANVKGISHKIKANGGKKLRLNIPSIPAPKIQAIACPTRPK